MCSSICCSSRDLPNSTLVCSGQGNNPSPVPLASLGSKGVVPQAVLQNLVPASRSHASQTQKLCTRLAQLAAYERVRSGTEAAGEASRALAMQRLRARNAAAREASAHAPPPRAPAAPPPPPAAPSSPNLGPPDSAAADSAPLHVRGSR